MTPGTPPRTESQHGRIASWSRCASCKAAIIWVVTRKGKDMPVDPETDISHFATYPQAAGWRRK